MTPYWHSWKPTDMIVYDNWRFLHAVSGHRPEYGRRVHRATIKGDYGLGRFESDRRGDRSLEMMA
jgi:taurine dioxygenase